MVRLHCGWECKIMQTELNVIGFGNNHLSSCKEGKYRESKKCGQREFWLPPVLYRTLPNPTSFGFSTSWDCFHLVGGLLLQGRDLNSLWQGENWNEKTHRLYDTKLVSASSVLLQQPSIFCKQINLLPVVVIPMTSAFERIYSSSSSLKCLRFLASSSKRSWSSAISVWHFSQASCTHLRYRRQRSLLHKFQTFLT